MTTRRDFLVGTGASIAGLVGLSGRAASFDLIDEFVPVDGEPRGHPLIVSTWHHGLAANAAAWKVLQQDRSALDAVEAGVRVSEGDPEVTSVGYGGRPDREGNVTLDSCIMDDKGNAGSVAFLQNIMHPVSVARLVMEKTPHVMLVGDGARQFAIEQGFTEEDLLTESSRKDWQQWLKTADYKPWSRALDSSVKEPVGHDTISMLAIDKAGNLSGSCTTSGLAYKMYGRVGDSPIIGAALFVDNEIGAACATGVGEEVMKTVGSFLIVELMRQGLSPDAACREAVGRIVAKNPAWPDLQVGYLAVDRAGNIGAYSIQKGFQFAVRDGQENKLFEAASKME